MVRRGVAKTTDCHCIFRERTIIAFMGAREREGECGADRFGEMRRDCAGLGRDIQRPRPDDFVPTAGDGILA